MTIKMTIDTQLINWMIQHCEPKFREEINKLILENEMLRKTLMELRDRHPLDGETTLGIIEKALSNKETAE